jgi:hypothetical protein
VSRAPGREPGAPSGALRAPDASPVEEELRGEILAFMGRPDRPVEAALDALALRVLQFQAGANPVYGALLRNRGMDAGDAEHWTAFPPVPVRAFRSAPPYVGDPAGAQATFRTSGTTGGHEARGTHRVRDLSLYHAALLPQARRHLAPDVSAPAGGEPALRVVALLPDPALLPESSLAHMAGVLHAAWDDGGGGFFADPTWALGLDRLHAALSDARRDGGPVLLLATAFALVHWLDAAKAHSEPGALLLPGGSRIMETGGFKGRSRSVERGALYEALSAATGVPLSRIVNEYGMTEMLSQFYEPVLSEGGPEDPRLRRLVGPPWVRTRVLDPVDLSPVPLGTPGLLCHLDLANLFSAALILTEDLGVEVEAPGAGGASGFQVLGRSPGSLPRGCSLSMEAWLEAAR